MMASRAPPRRPAGSTWESCNRWGMRCASCDNHIGVIHFSANNLASPQNPGGSHHRTNDRERKRYG